jgi:hypothetical protein
MVRTNLAVKTALPAEVDSGELIRGPVVKPPGLAVLRCGDPAIKAVLRAKEIQALSRFLRFALYDLDEAYVFPRAFVAVEQMQKAAHMIRCARALCFEAPQVEFLRQNAAAITK